MESDLNQILRQKYGSMDPYNVVPAEEFLRAVKQLRVRTATSLERELFYAIRRIRRDVSQDIENLLLS